MATQQPPKPAEATKLPKKTYQVEKNFIFKTRVNIKGQLADFNDFEAAAIMKVAPGAITARKTKEVN